MILTRKYLPAHSVIKHQVKKNIYTQLIGR